MGTESLYRNKRSKAQAVGRGKATRAPYAKVLIVCEGEKTEVNYFNEIKTYYELNSTNIKISGKCGSAPISVAQHAFELYREELKARRDPFDRVYCVFDQDSHTSFAQAVIEINKQKPAGVFHAITSTPCFEYWFLLHFVHSQRPFTGSGSQSPAEQLIGYLTSNHWKEYRKGEKGIFKSLIQDLPQAKLRAAQIAAASTASGTTNPLTNVHLMVDYLQKIRA